MKKHYLFCSILLGLCIAPMLVYSQASLVKDIFPGGNSAPNELTNVNGTLFFVADDGTHGRELWKSDGTEAGTVLVKDILPGGSSSDPGGFINLNGTLFFSAGDDTHGRELWKSDGTEAGTVLVKDILPGSISSFPSLLNVNSILLFTADDGTHGRELWKSDGTEAGTVLVKDINPGNGSSIISPPEFADVNGTLFFKASDGLNNFGLWKSDGTEVGTVLIEVIPHLSNVSIPHEFTNVNGILFFIAWDAAHGEELWRSDGTEAGTFVIDINPGSEGSGPIELASVNGTLFFWAFDGSPGEELWKSDGTEDGTVLVKDIYPGGFSQDICCLVNGNGTLFFRGEDGIHGPELWKSDGTEAGTVLVKDIFPGSEGSDAAPFDININGNVYFFATDGTHGGLWKSDGTEAGTILAAAISPGINFNLVNIGSTLYFQASDGTHGRELWKYEETIQKQAVQNFTLVNADTDTDILELRQGMQLNLNELPHAKLNIRANTHPPTVGSVMLQLSGQVNATRKENTAPYALFGDSNGNYEGQNLGLGNYTITATPYSKANLKGEKGVSLTLHFSITEQAIQSVQSFTLVNADTDTDILELTEGMQLNLNELPHAKLNIRANTTPPTVGSVFLQLSGAVKASRTENTAPYALFGDSNGNYDGQNLGKGNYTIKATPYSMTNRKGKQGRSLSLNFSIVDTQVLNARIATEGDGKTSKNVEGERLLSLPQKSWVYPNPFTHTFTVELSDFSGENVEVHLYDLYGKPLMIKNILTTSGTIEVDAAHTTMGAGPYLLKLIWGNRVEVIKLIRKN